MQYFVFKTLDEKLKKFMIYLSNSLKTYTVACTIVVCKSICLISILLKRYTLIIELNALLKILFYLSFYIIRKKIVTFRRFKLKDIHMEQVRKYY